MPRTLLFIAIAVLCSAAASAQPPPAPVRLTFRQAIEMATAVDRNPSVQMAEGAVQIAEARLAQARALRLPAVEGGLTEQHQTRNLSAQGFQFQTGVPGFTIPAKVGPFTTFDARLFVTQNVFDASAQRRSDALKQGIEASRTDVTLHRERSAAQSARDYLSALRADAAIEAARAGVATAERLVQLATDRQSAGRAAAIEVTRARLRLAVERRTLAAAGHERELAYLQLRQSLNLDLDAPLELADRLLFASEDASSPTSILAAALEARPELQSSRSREAAARTSDEAVRLEALPSVVAFADVGPIESIVTHTVGVSVKVPIFDGGRRAARRQETLAVVRQHETEQRDLRRQVEVQVRRASSHLKAAAAAIEEADAALSLAESELSETTRRFEGGVTGNVEVIEAQAKLATAKDDRIASVFAWHQARVDLAQACGTAASLTLPATGR